MQKAKLKKVGELTSWRVSAFQQKNS